MNEHHLEFLKAAKQQWDEVFGIKEGFETQREIRLWAQYMLDYDRKPVQSSFPIKEQEVGENQTYNPNNNESKQASDKQLNLLKKLGHEGELPLTLDGASILIKQLLEKKEKKEKESS